MAPDIGAGAGSIGVCPAPLGGLRSLGRPGTVSGAPGGGCSRHRGPYVGPAGGAARAFCRRHRAVPDQVCRPVVRLLLPQVARGSHRVEPGSQRAPCMRGVCRHTHQGASDWVEARGRCAVQASERPRWGDGSSEAHARPEGPSAQRPRPWPTARNRGPRLKTQDALLAERRRTPARMADMAPGRRDPMSVCRGSEVAGAIAWPGGRGSARRPFSCSVRRRTHPSACEVGGNSSVRLEGRPVCPSRAPEHGRTRPRAKRAATAQFAPRGEAYAPRGRRSTDAPVRVRSGRQQFSSPRGATRMPLAGAGARTHPSACEAGGDSSVRPRMRVAARCAGASADVHVRPDAPDRHAGACRLAGRAGQTKSRRTTPA